MNKICGIEKVDNGYIVSYLSSYCSKTKVFTTIEEVLTFVYTHFTLPVDKVNIEVKLEPWD